MKDAIAYAHDAGFFSFNVIGWKAEFERLIEAVRADAIADHIRDATKMVAAPMKQGLDVLHPLASELPRSTCTHAHQSVTHYSNETWTQQREECGHIIKSGTYVNSDGALTEEKTTSVSNGLCGGCGKKAADGFALYCVKCWEKVNGESTLMNPPPHNAHVLKPDSDIIAEQAERDQVFSVCCKPHDKDSPVGYFYPPANELDSWEQAAACDDPDAVPLYADPIEPVKQYLDCGGAHHHRYCGSFGD